MINYLMTVNEESKEKEHDYERQEYWSNHGIDNPKKEIKLQARKSLWKINTSRIHRPISIAISFNYKHVFQMKNDKRLQPENLTRNASPTIHHYICNEKGSLHWY